MIDFGLTVLAVVIGFLLIGVLVRVLPKPKTPMVCAFCGAEAWCSNDIVEHVKRCEKHPLRRELDGAVEHAKRLIEQRSELEAKVWQLEKRIEELKRPLDVKTC